MALKYAKGPVSFLYNDVPNKEGITKRSKVKQLLWGDWIEVVAPEKSGWLMVTHGKKKYFMRAKDLQDERVLEIIFLDIGQGDGCILTEPGSHLDPRILVIDAGVGRNMNAFLNWQFKDFNSSGKIHAAVITHSDQDHYKGFQYIFDNKNFQIGHVYHNGIVERAGADLLGPVHNGYLTEVIATDAQMHTLMSDPANRGSKAYPKLLHTAITSPRIGPIAALTTEHGEKQNGKTWVPGFPPNGQGKLAIEILGPVVETDAAGNAQLRAFGKDPTSTSMDNGKTKNGHSVLLRLEFKNFRVLFGGDLNKSSETFLMLWYGDDKHVPAPLTDNHNAEQRTAEADVIERAGRHFDVDLMKSCHHGSADVTEGFLKANSASAFVISSGDDEGYVHPRPDLLGLLGKAGIGPRPLLLSTELLRSTRERENPKIRKDLEAITSKIETEIVKGAAADQVLLKELQSKRKKLRDEIFKRNVGVYGAVNLRTDGTTAVIAFRKEKAPPTSRWFFYELRPDQNGNGFIPELSGQ